MRHRLHNEDGFTLIELMMVVTIVAALVAVAVLGLQRVEGESQDRKTQAGLRDTILLERQWLFENGTYTSIPANIQSLDPGWFPFAAPDDLDRPFLFLGAGGQAVCLFAVSDSGGWWAVYEDSATGAWYGEALPFPCNNALTATFQRDPW